MESRVQTRHSTGAVRERRVWNFSIRKQQNVDSCEKEHVAVENSGKSSKVELLLKGKPLLKKSHMAKKYKEERLLSKNSDEQRQTESARNAECKRLFSPKADKDVFVNVKKHHSQKNKVDKEMKEVACKSADIKKRKCDRVHGSAGATDNGTCRKKKDSSPDKKTQDVCPSLSIERIENISGEPVKLVIPRGQEEALIENWAKTFTDNNDSLCSLNAKCVKLVKGELIELSDGNRAVKVPKFEQENEIILIAVGNICRSAPQQLEIDKTEELDSGSEIRSLTEENEGSTENTCSDHFDIGSDKMMLKIPQEDFEEVIKDSENQKNFDDKIIKENESKRLDVEAKVNEIFPTAEEKMKKKPETDLISAEKDETVGEELKDAVNENENSLPGTKDQSIQNDMDDESSDDVDLAESDLIKEANPTDKQNMSVLSDRNTKNYKNKKSNDAVCDSYSKPGRRRYKKDKNFACSFCSKRFSENRDLVVHLRTHTGERPFQCEICPKAFTQKNVLKTHMRTHTGEKPYVCQYCGKAFADSSSLKVHVRFHTGERPYKCDHCERRFPHSSALKSHMLVHTGEKKFVCHLCGKACATTMAFNSHMRVHTGEKLYACKVCDRRFHSTRNRRRHMAIHTGKKKYFMCEICGKNISSSTNFNKHMKIHLTEKPFVCEICDKRFRDKKAFKNHLKAHSERIAFVCQTCPKQFVKMSHLKRHMLTHLDNGEQSREDERITEMYSCHFCDKKYKSRVGLMKHHTTHPEVQNIIYKCAVCNKRFATLAFLEEHVTLYGHIKTEGENEDIVYVTTEEQPEKDYSCSICQERFLNHQLFEEHFKSHGGVAIRPDGASGENSLISNENEPIVFEKGNLEDIHNSEHHENAENVEHLEVSQIIDRFEQSEQLDQIIEGNALENIDHLEEVDHIEYVIREDGTEQPTVQTIVYITVGSKDSEKQ